MYESIDILNTIILGNSEKVLSEIPENIIDMTITSPPYDNLRTYNGNNDLWNKNVWKKIIKELYRITKDGGVIVWIVGDATIKGSETGTSFKQALYFKEVGFNLHDTMIWNKGGFSAVGALKTRYAPVFEYMFVFSKGKIATFNPIKDRKTKHGGKEVGGTIRNPDGSMKPMSKRMIINEYSQRFNIWDISPQRQSGKNKHVAPFPVSLITDHILSWSNKDDIILDPFMGSGTTAVACKQLNRNFVGIELEQQYIDIANERLKNENVQTIN